MIILIRAGSRRGRGRDGWNIMSERFGSAHPSLWYIWYHLQKDLPESQRKDAIMKIGRGIGKEIDTSTIDTIEDFISVVKEFLVNEWKITEKANITWDQGEDGIKVKCHMDACKMCFANSHFKTSDGGTPTCLFPQVMMGALTKARSKLKFRNVAFDCVDKPGPVGECIMTFNA